VRELLLNLIVLLLGVGALVSPRIGLFGYFWFALLRPDVLAWAYGENRYSMALAAATLLGCARLIPFGVLNGFRNPIVLSLLALQIPVGLSVVFAVNINLALTPWTNFLKMIMMVLLIPIVIQDRQMLRQFIILMGLSIGVLGAKFGVFGMFHGGVRFMHGYGGFMSENNSLALGLLMGVPLCWYGRRLVTARWLKALLIFCAVSSLAGIIMCHSRGVTLTMACVFLLIARHAKRKIGVILLIGLVALPPILLVQDSFVSRMSTLGDPLADDSAASRITFAKAALRVWLDYPLFGVGFGFRNYQALAPHYVGYQTKAVVHNSYLQILADSGIFGFLIFTGMVWGTIWWLGRLIKKFEALDPEMAHIAMAIRVSLFAFAVGSLFGSRLHFDFLYMLLMSAACVYSIRRSESTHAEAKTSVASIAAPTLQPEPQPQFRLAWNPGGGPRGRS